MADFLLVLTEPFSQLSQLRRCEQILVEIVVFERGWPRWVTLSANFRRNEGHPPTTVGVRKIESLSYRVALFACLRLAVLTPLSCDRQTDVRVRRTAHDDSKYRASIASPG